MKRKFNLGDFVIINEKCKENWKRSRWFDSSPLGVGTVSAIDWEYRGDYSYSINTYKRILYSATAGTTKKKFSFYSWELNLVSRNEKKV